MEQQTQRTPMPVVTLSNPAGLYDASQNGYSHIAEVAPGTRTVYVSGQGGEDESGALAPDFRGQVRQALSNLVTALTAAGAGTVDVAKLTVLIVNHTEDRLHVFGDELVRTFGEGDKPACTLIPVSRMALDGMLFEVEATAVVAGSRA